MRRRPITAMAWATLVLAGPGCSESGQPAGPAGPAPDSSAVYQDEAVDSSSDTPGVTDSEHCTPECLGRECGDDGCGGSCGECSEPNVCKQGACACQPLCVKGSKTCGPDGCGGWCVCPSDQVCLWPERRCEPPKPDCANGWCRIPAAAFMVGKPYYWEMQIEWMAEQLGTLLPISEPPPFHPVLLTREILVQQTELTVGLWEEVMGEGSSAQCADCPASCPEAHRTPWEYMAFSNALSEREGLDPCYAMEGCYSDKEFGNVVCERVDFAGPDCTGYRLPSWAEQRLATNAGALHCMWNGQTFDPDWSFCSPFSPMSPCAWHCGNDQMEDKALCGPYKFDWGAHPVGQKLPNPFGLHDAVGNLVEIAMEPSVLTGDLEVDPGFPAELGAGWTFASSPGSNKGSPCLVTSAKGTNACPEAMQSGLIGVRLVRTLEQTEAYRGPLASTSEEQQQRNGYYGPSQDSCEHNGAGR